MECYGVLRSNGASIASSDAPRRGSRKHVWVAPGAGSPGTWAAHVPSGGAHVPGAARAPGRPGEAGLPGICGATSVRIHDGGIAHSLSGAIIVGIRCEMIMMSTGTRLYSWCSYAAPAMRVLQGRVVPAQVRVSVLVPCGTS